MTHPVASGGVRCPKCHTDDTKVIDSREAEEGTSIRRRRLCASCQHRFTTYERLEPIPLTVRKRSGVTEPFDRDKLSRGLVQAVAGRAVAAEAVQALAADLAEWAESQGPEISSDAIGVAVLERLRTLDPVSYLRFASVYKGFEDLADFEAEVEELQRDAPAPDLAAIPLEKTTAPKTPEPERR